MSDYDMTIHSNPDARAWAKFFCEKNPNVMDEEVMIVWFANAMMAMHDYLFGIKAINGDHADYLLNGEEYDQKNKI
jgi:hypothetical protein